MYDYGARNYDPALGRWMNIDPLAEKYINISPYTYVANSPIILIDLDGKKIVFAKNTSKEFKQNFAKAVAYLKQHKMDGILAKLQASDQIFTIAEGKSSSYRGRTTRFIGMMKQVFHIQMELIYLQQQF